MTDPVTGGQKGSKPERFSLLPFDALDEILRAYNYGSKKYADHNWRKGYNWSLSFDAAMRHLTAWWEREEKDPESGLSHLAHAGWHVLCLLWFQLNGAGTDDRWEKLPTKAAEGSKVFYPGSIRELDGLGRDRSVADKLFKFKGLEVLTQECSNPGCSCRVDFKSWEELNNG